jgi:AcrR family transcriptional regulator
MSVTAIILADDVNRCHHAYISGMGRWEPGAAKRLEEAAMDLYEQHGYDQTTVEDIAQRAGLTERTFFRHYADKREVLFGGSADLRESLVREVARAPEAPISRNGS